MGDVWYMVAIGLATIFGTGRLTRLLVHDDFPPSVWVRTRWDGLTREGPWSALVHCGFCAAPWIMAATLAWGLATSFHWTWWGFYGWLALSYLASIVVAWDQPPD